MRAFRSLNVRGAMAFLLTAVTALSGCPADPSMPDKPDIAPVITLKELQIAGAPEALVQGTSYALRLQGSYSNGDLKDLTQRADWSTSDAALLDVSGADGTRGVLSAKSPGGPVTITAQIEGKSATASIRVSEVALVAIAVQRAPQELALGTQVQLEALGTFMNGHGQDLTASVQWSSSNSSVAEISSAGLVTAKAEGDVSFLASFKGVTGAASIKVTKEVPVAVVVQAPLAKLAPRTQQRLRAVAKLSNGAEQDITGSVTWAVSDDAVASVSTNPPGLLRALAKGAVKVTALLKTPSKDLSGDLDLQVSGAKIQKVAVTALNPMNPAAVPAGYALQLRASGAFDDGTEQDLSAEAQWASADPSIAALESPGLVRGLKEGGVVDISAAFDGESGQLSFRVTDAVLERIAVTPGDAAVHKGLTQQFQASGHFSNGEDRPISEAVTWESLDPQLAIISNSSGSRGLATAVKPGTVQIRASRGAVSAEVALLIKDPKLMTLALLPGDAAIDAGTTLQYNAIGTYSDGERVDVGERAAWASADETVATISNTAGSVGRATAVKAGATRISAQLDGVSSDTALTVK